MHLRREMGLRARVCALALGVAVLGVGLASPARASEARHYEKVSPTDKGNGDIVGDGATNVASRAGDAVTLSTRTPFGDTIGSGVSGQTQYVVRRTAAGWAAHSITPQPRASAYQTLVGATRYQAYSDDLRSAVLWGYDFPAAAPGGLPERTNIYVEDTASRGLRPVTLFQNGLPDPLPHPIFELSSSGFDWGVSADAKHVAFVSRAQYLPEAASGGVPNVYQWDDGRLSLAGILPDGRVPVDGTDQPSSYRGAMSADGSRLVFSASNGGESQLFQRIGGTRTAWVSESELDPSDPSYQQFASQVTLRAVTPDGRNVFFTTPTPLVRGDGNGGTDLYRWTASDEPARDSNLTMVSHGDLVDGQVIGTSDDGQRVYYQTAGSEIVFWDHTTSRLVVSPVVPAPALADQLAVDSTPGLGRVTPDGTYLAFAARSVTDLGPNGEVTNGKLEMYLSRDGQRPLCVSCPSGPATSEASVLPEATVGIITYFSPGIRPQFLAEDGRVFFSTAETLVPEDANGVTDVYEYDPADGSLSLVTTGKGSEPSYFTDASASGDDVFVVTRQNLVKSDSDGLVDLYDARIGDSVPDQPVPSTNVNCTGENCQPPPAVTPPEDQIGSASFDGDESPAAGKPAGLKARKSFAFRGATGSLRVELTGPGKVSWAGKGLRSGSKGRSRAGALVLGVSLARHARSILRKSGTYTTSVRLTLTSDEGRVSRTARVTFQAAAKKGR